MDPSPQKFASDFNAAKDMRESVMYALSNEGFGPLQSFSQLPTDHEHVLPDGRKVKLYFPHGRGYMVRRIANQDLDESRKSIAEKTIILPEDDSQNAPIQLYFVLFVGHKKDVGVAEDAGETSWDMDDELKKDMVDIEEILSYSSCERTVGGDWTNLVIFTSLRVIDKWRRSAQHATAVRDFSPQYYSTIRIHRGQIQGDIRNGIFNLQRTLFLNYEKDGSTSKREEKYWNYSEPSQGNKSVLFKC